MPSALAWLLLRKVIHRKSYPQNDAIFPNEINDLAAPGLKPPRRKSLILKAFLPNARLK